MRKQKLISSIFILLSLLISFQVKAHCQIPCGIYNDYNRIQTILEDATTISKSMTMIQALAKQNDVNAKHNTTRWIINKENHAQNIIDIIGNYFLTQRVKESQKDYIERLKKHHKIIVLAMKTKQNYELEHAQKLEKAIQAIESYYPEHKH